MTHLPYPSSDFPRSDELLERMRHSPRRALLFDMDGVLTDSEPFMIEACRRFFRQNHGVDPEPADFFPFFGAGEHGFFGGVAEKHGIRLDFESDRLWIYRHYREAILDSVPDMHGGEREAGGLKALPGAREVVALATEAGLRLAVATSASQLKADITLVHIGLPPELFDIVVTAEDIAHNKPNPEIFERSAERLGVPAHECLVIEDSLNGVRAGRAAGMEVIAVATAGVTEDSLKSAGASHVINDLTEFPFAAFDGDH